MNINESKVNDEIIKKLSLTETDISIFASFVYGLKIYELPNKYKTYLLECDKNGEPFYDDCFLIRKERIVDSKKEVSHLKVSNLFLLNTDAEIIMLFINQDFETN